MKPSLRLGLIGLFAVVAAAFGIAQLTPAAVQAQAAKTCPTATATTATCTLTVGAATPLAPGGVTTVTVSALAPATVTTVTATLTVPGAGLVTVAPGLTPDTFTIACGGVLPCSGFTVSEAITGTGFVGGTTTITNTGVATAPGGIAFVATSAALVIAAPGTATPPLPAGTTKTCTPTTPAPGATVTCTVAVPAGVGSPVVLTVTGATPTAGTVAPAAAGTSVVAATATGGTITVTCTPAGVACAAMTITETLTAGLTPGTTITETLTTGAGTAVALPTATPITVTSVPTTITVAGCVAAATIAAPTAGGPIIPAGTTLITTAAPGTAVTCRIAFSDTDAVPTFVSSGTVTITRNSPSGVTVSGSGVPAGPSIAVHCPTGGGVGTELCQFVDVTFNSTATTPLGAAIIHVNYNPDFPAANAAADADLTPFTFVQGVAGFVQPVGLLIACTSTVAGPFTGPVPGPIGNINIIAVGVLPGTLPCTVTPVNAAGVATPAAPGTIEVSSVAGVLLTSAGQLTSNLRIACDTAPTVTIGVTINVNTCQGVAFNILGLAVGPVDIRARYEPSTVAAAAGITEIEANTNVAFVAPPVTVSLLLSPNPVVVGQTGTATARFNRSFNCSAAFGFGTGAVLGGNVCIDPTTGLPIAFDFGSGLNGSVIFTIDNSVVASWVNQSSNPVSAPQVTGFVATANQTVVRCGFFPTTGFPVTNVTNPNPSLTGPLANFFGGCDSAAATYKGLNAGNANVNATFVPDLPGAFGSTTVGLSPAVTPLLGLFSNSQPTQTRVLNVVAAPPSGTQQLVRGCNNVTPTVSESATAYAARVTPQGALVAIWEHQAATNTFKGFSPLAGAPNDLSAVTRLKPVFVCVNAAATLDQPPA